MLNTSKPLFPMFVKLDGRPCVVIGGGKVAEGKIWSLLECGARVFVIAPTVDDNLRKLAEEGEIEWAPREYREGDLEGAALAVCATDHTEVHRRAAAEARERGIPVNVVDVPHLCDFFYPSVLRRGDLAIAISTHGRVPSAARRVRETIEENFGPEYGQWLQILSDVRNRLMDESRLDYSARCEILDKLMDLPTLSLLREGRAEEAKREVEACASRLLA
ncbi:bifunctional precorrin-2 dehydrogenase/sirohydrochlorin ferrochelatase [bacterium]|nr:bifunctional precorrin-2 dehydrogenase/sirohydrochlorin ferrochelatase [bacterium]